MDWSETEGILRAAEKCNGSGDCRKLPATAATMCPSYHATRNEKDTTRARANALRSILTEKGAHQPFDSEELKEVLELCLSCKGCKRECPSNVDMAAMKAEFSYAYQKTTRHTAAQQNLWALPNPGCIGSTGGSSGECHQQFTSCKTQFGHSGKTQFAQIHTLDGIECGEERGQIL
jgi:Fe-S oxidoreductase